MIKLFEAFAGYGTATFALKALGIEHDLVGYSEIDKYAVQCFEQNHGGKNFGDISKIDWSQVPDFDLLTGGFPCQDVSNAGKQDLEKGRSVLGFELTKALVEKQPKYFLFENVKGILSDKFDDFLTSLLRQWKDAGYNVYYKKLNTRDFGIPQNRERVFFVGIRNDVVEELMRPEDFGYCFEWPIEFDLKLKLKDLLEVDVDEKYFLKEEQVEKIMSKSVKRTQSNRIVKGDVSQTISAGTHDYSMGAIKLEEVTKDVSDAQRIYDSNGCAKTLKGLGGGQGAKTGLYVVGCVVRQRNRHNKNEVKGQQLESHGKEFANSITSVQKDSMILVKNATKKGYQKALVGDGISLEQPNSKTRRGRVQKEGVSTLQTSGQQGVLDKDRVRRLTPKECFRLQGFLKDEVNLEGLSDTQKYKLAGNGQSVNVVKLIFKELLK